MSSEELYKKEFEKMLATEKKNGDSYRYYITQLQDPLLLEKFKKIYSDEEMHVKLVQGFIAAINGI